MHTCVLITLLVHFLHKSTCLLLALSESVGMCKRSVAGEEDGDARLGRLWREERKTSVIVNITRQLLECTPPQSKRDKQRVSENVSVRECLGCLCFVGGRDDRGPR